MVKPSHQKTPKGSRSLASTQNDHISDARFANIQTDPRFRLPSKKNTHVRIDKRFERMLRDDAFSSRAKVDRYGRKLPKDAAKKELDRYYRIEDDQNGPIQDDEVERELKRANAKLEEEDVPSFTEESSSDEESDVDDSEQEEIFGILDVQEADREGVPLGEVSTRLAVVNLDWDNIRAADLMAVFSSFTQGAEQIKRISIYPSDFGRDRMEREEMEGPPKEIFAKGNGKATHTARETDSEGQDGDSSDSEDDEQIKRSLIQEGNDQDFNSAKLRRYQLERLRYYYAVIVCSSPSIAQSIYEAVDGTEYLTTANFFDLRFIPDDTDFSHDKPRDECSRVPDVYRPNEFVTDALQHSKVRLTWDAEDGTRKEAQKRAFAASRANIDENDLKAYLGSDTSSDDDDVPEPIVVDATTAKGIEPQQANDAPSEPPLKISKKESERQRMRALLGLDAKPTTTKSKGSKADQPDPGGDMQITFSSGLTTSTSEPKTSVFTNSPNDREETTVEKYVRKEKERKARRKSKLKGAREEGDNAADTSAQAPTQPDNIPPNDKPTAQEASDGQEDLGFSDPFFADPSSTTTALRTPSSRKAARALKKAELKTSAAAPAAQRAELELLTLPDDADPSSQTHLKHFNMKDIVRAEKALAKSKKSKKRKASDREKEREAAKLLGEDAFRVDAKDPRFGAVFEKPEFAIDPSHPRFLGTGGMKELLEEGRRKRKRKGEGDGEVEEEEKEEVGRKARRKKEHGDGGGEDVARLLERVKAKCKG
ncbi:MAG: hypothetical protein Q9184_002190 [Pyrenodesmia sp. 2 TL-2023]